MLVNFKVKSYNEGEMLLGLYRVSIERLLKLLYSVVKSLLSSDALIILTILTLFSAGFSIYFFNRPVNPSVQLSDFSFKLDADVRTVELSVKVMVGSVELKQFFINNLTVYRWSSDRRILREGEEARCVLWFPWRMGEDYAVRLVTVDDRSFEVLVRAPVFEPVLGLDLRDVGGFSSGGSLRVGLLYGAVGNGTDWLHMVLFTYRSFDRPNRSVYVFYDSRFMAREGLRRAEAIMGYLRGWNVSVNSLDYDGLRGLIRDEPRSVLILVNPLKDGFGRRLLDAAPAPLLDPNGNGYLRDDSRHGRSLLYDLMADEGLILVTVGSNQPYKRILYGDGSYRLARDSAEAFDAHRFLTPADGDESIIRGVGFLGDYSPTRISGTLGLAYREEAYGFDKGALERYGLSYYAYGEYRLSMGDRSLSLLMPVFIRVGRGGWLAMGDGGYWLSDEQLSHDLFMILLQSIWDSDWVPYGWYWDSGANFHSGAGLIKAEGSLDTEGIPQKIVGERLIVRVLGVVYSADLKRGIVVEKILEYRLP